MFNLVPFAGSRGVGTHGDGDPQFVRQLLSMKLPGPLATPLAPAPSGMCIKRSGNVVNL